MNTQTDQMDKALNWVSHVVLSCVHAVVLSAALPDVVLCPSLQFVLLSATVLTCFPILTLSHYLASMFVMVISNASVLLAALPAFVSAGHVQQGQRDAPSTTAKPKPAAMAAIPEETPLFFRIL